MNTDKVLLIIDDEEFIGEILVEIFSPHFDRVLYCSQAKEALEITKTTKLAGILTDLSMPELPGDQLVRLVRSRGDLTPIMFLTGHASKEMVLSAMRLGVTNVFEKPFDNDFLVESVNRALEIEKRRKNITVQTDPDKIAHEKKLLGLMYVVSETKKAS